MVAIGSLVYSVIADTQQFQQGIVATRRELREARKTFENTRTPAEKLGAELEATAELMRKGAIDTETFVRAVAKASDGTEEAAAEQRKLIKSLREQAEQIKRTAEETGSLTMSEQARVTQLRQLANATEQAVEQVEREAKATREAAEAENRKQAQERESIALAKRQERATEKVTRELHQQRLAMLETIPVAGRMATQIGALAAAAGPAGVAITVAAASIYAGAKAARLLARETAESMAEIDELAKTARKLGATTSELVGLRLAAEQFSGMAAPQFDTALQRMTRRLAEAAVGTGEAQGALKELHLDAVAVSAKGPAEAFKDISEAIKKVQDPAQQLRLAFKLFDSEGAGLVTTLNAGREAMEEAQEKAEWLGIAISEVDARQIETTNDALGDMRDSFDGIGNSLAIAFSPAIEVAAKDMTNLTVSMREGVDAAQELQLRIARLYGGMKDVSNFAAGMGRFQTGDLMGGLRMMNEARKLTSASRAQMDAARSIKKTRKAMEEALNPPQEQIEAGEQSAIQKRIGELYDLRRELLMTKGQIEDSKFFQTGASDAEIRELQIARDMLEERQKIVDARKKEREEAEKLAKKEQADRKARMDDLKQQGQSIADSMRSPFEQLVKDLADTKLLLDVGAIDVGTAQMQAKALQAAFTDTKPLKVEMPTARTGSREEFQLVSRILNGQKDEETRRETTKIELLQAMKAANERAAAALEELKLAESV